MSFTQLLYHIVFSTKHRNSTIPHEYAEELYRLITHIAKKEECHVYRVGGMENHIHLLVSIPADKTVSKIVQNIKRESSIVLGKHPNFPNWEGWNEGYGAFTCSWSDKNNVINYIKRQREHHLTVSAEDEFREFLIQNGYEK